MRHALLVLALAGCDWSLNRMQEQPKCVLNGATKLLPNDSCNLLPPEGAVAMTTPDEAPPPLTPQLLARGRDRFERICAACHGVAADGQSQVARAMTQRRPPSLVDAAAASLTDAKILASMESGYGVMPSYRTMLAPADRFAVLHYVRALQQREVPLAELPAALQQEARQWLH